MCKVSDMLLFGNALVTMPGKAPATCAYSAEVLKSYAFINELKGRYSILGLHCVLCICLQRTDLHLYLPPPRSQVNGSNPIQQGINWCVLVLSDFPPRSRLNGLPAEG